MDASESGWGLQQAVQHLHAQQHNFTQQQRQQQQQKQKQCHVRAKRRAPPGASAALYVLIVPMYAVAIAKMAVDMACGQSQPLGAAEPMAAGLTPFASTRACRAWAMSDPSGAMARLGTTSAAYLVVPFTVSLLGAVAALLQPPGCSWSLPRHISRLHMLGTRAVTIAALLAQRAGISTVLLPCPVTLWSVRNLWLVPGSLYESILTNQGLRKEVRSASLIVDAAMFALNAAMLWLVADADGAPHLRSAGVLVAVAAASIAVPALRAATGVLLPVLRARRPAAARANKGGGAATASARADKGGDNGAATAAEAPCMTMDLQGWSVTKERPVGGGPDTHSVAATAAARALLAPCSVDGAAAASPRACASSEVSTEPPPRACASSEISGEPAPCAMVLPRAGAQEAAAAGAGVGSWSQQLLDVPYTPLYPQTVRLVIKIKDREPEELVPDWQQALSRMVQPRCTLRSFAVRRGCTQLVFDADEGGADALLETLTQGMLKHGSAHGTFELHMAPASPPSSACLPSVFVGSRDRHMSLAVQDGRTRSPHTPADGASPPAVLSAFPLVAELPSASAAAADADGGVETEAELLLSAPLLSGSSLLVRHATCGYLRVAWAGYAYDGKHGGRRGGYDEDLGGREHGCRYGGYDEDPGGREHGSNVRLLVRFAAPRTPGRVRFEVVDGMTGRLGASAAQLLLPSAAAVAELLAVACASAAPPCPSTPCALYGKQPCPHVSGNVDAAAVHPWAQRGARGNAAVHPVVADIASWVDAAVLAAAHRGSPGGASEFEAARVRDALVGFCGLLRLDALRAMLLAMDAQRAEALAADPPCAMLRRTEARSGLATPGAGGGGGEDAETLRHGTCFSAPCDPAAAAAAPWSGSAAAATQRIARPSDGLSQGRCLTADCFLVARMVCALAAVVLRARRLVAHWVVLNFVEVLLTLLLAVRTLTTPPARLASALGCAERALRCDFAERAMLLRTAAFAAFTAGFPPRPPRASDVPSTAFLVMGFIADAAFTWIPSPMHGSLETLLALAAAYGVSFGAWGWKYGLQHSVAAGVMVAGSVVAVNLWPRVAPARQTRGATVGSTRHTHGSTAGSTRHMCCGTAGSSQPGDIGKAKQM
uniref:Uncharacterized protein n=1 Tax=Chlamydomonas euryale TaxID=1486919 RepID=A0A7R9YWJ3_9CHLO